MQSEMFTVIALSAIFAFAVLVWSAQPIESVQRTSEGYMLITTSERGYIQRLCGADSPTIIGCAKWLQGPPEQKDPFCIIMVLRGGGENFTEAQTIDHEKRHCREGKFHDTLGNEK